jgi:exonuclease VII small subunit
MKISKKQLIRMIKEEYAAVAADMPAAAPMPTAAPPMPAAGDDVPLATVTESDAPEEQLVVEMETAISNLEMVMESLEAASDICENCVQEVAAQGPVLSAVSAQVGALKETLAAVEEIVVESTEAAPAAAAPAAEAPAATEAQMESIRRKLIRRLR